MADIAVVQADITTVPTDAVVNAANNRMRGGGGVDGAIHRAGGPTVLADCVARFPHGLATGDAGWTTAGDLPARWVIHTVGPNYAAGHHDRDLLTSCYRRCLEVADGLGARTVTFPLVSAGTYGWPTTDAIDAALETIASTTSSVERVTLVTLDASTCGTIGAAIRRDLALRLLQSVRVLHERGLTTLRIRPGMNASGTSWRVEIAPAAVPLGRPSSVSAPGVARWTSMAGTCFADTYVNPGMSAQAVADIVMTELPDRAALERASSPGDAAYVEWYAGLLRLCEENKLLPVSYSDAIEPVHRTGWEIGWGSGVRYPAPPA